MDRVNTRTKGFLATVVSATFFGFIPLMVKVVCSGGGNTLAAAFYSFCPVFAGTLYLFKSEKNSDEDHENAASGYRPDYRTGLRRDDLDSVFVLQLHTAWNGDNHPLHLSGLHNFGMRDFPALKNQKMKVLAVALSFGGILFFYNADGSVSLPGMALAFASGMTYAFYTIYLRESSLKDMDSVKLIFCLNTVGAAMMGAVALIAGDFTVGLTPAAWAVAVFLAVSASFIGVLGYQVGVKCIGPQNTAILSTFEPITSVILGILVLSGKLFA